MVQREALHHLEQRGVIEATGVRRDELVHPVFLCAVCVCVRKDGSALLNTHLVLNRLQNSVVKQVNHVFPLLNVKCFTEFE